MTPEELSARYGSLKQLTSGPVRSVLAMRSATKAIVMVHHFEAPPEDPSHDLLALLEYLPVEKKQRIVERLDVGGKPVVVTKMLHNFVSLEAWLTELGSPESPPLPPSHRPGQTPAPDRSRPAAPPPPQPPPPPAATIPGSSDATVVLAPKLPAKPPVPPAQVVETGIAAPFTDPGVGQEPPIAAKGPPASPAPVTPLQQGEFTAMFGAPGPARPPAPPPTPVAPAAAAPPPPPAPA
ncbi:MAG TPA: hypothetical protein VG692_17715, partial [Gemmatimonadales bacterium]|nr:hypothetical protein [Gemmatimonadales bacterium]